MLTDRPRKRCSHTNLWERLYDLDFRHQRTDPSLVVSINNQDGARRANTKDPLFVIDSGEFHS